MQCKFKTRDGNRCQERQELRIIPETRRIERIKERGGADDRIIGVADTELPEDGYCYYHHKMMKGMLEPVIGNFTTHDQAKFLLARSEYLENF